jgi:hypothetical protein
MLKMRIITGIISFCFLLVAVEAVRRRKFMEKFALLWIFSGVLVFIFSVYPELLFKLAAMTGIYYLTLVFLFSVIFILLILLYSSIYISKLTESNKELAQEIGILKLKFNRQKDKKDEQK